MTRDELVAEAFSIAAEDGEITEARFQAEHPELSSDEVWDVVCDARELILDESYELCFPGCPPWRK